MAMIYIINLLAFGLSCSVIPRLALEKKRDLFLLIVVSAGLNGALVAARLIS